MPSEPPDADPHVRWCGGRRGELGAYPITVWARTDRLEALEKMQDLVESAGVA
jgi:hypothetical protein